MIRKVFNIVTSTGSEHTIHIGKIVSAESPAYDLCILISRLDCLCGFKNEPAIFFCINSVLPAPDTIWLIPHLVQFYFSFIASCQGANIIVPGCFFFLRVDWGTTYRSIYLFCRFRIQIIAVGKADPRL